MALYTPNNLYVFCAAMVGAHSGLLANSSPLSTSPTYSGYVDTNPIAVAFAQAVDTAWGTSTEPTIYQKDEIEQLATLYFSRYNPPAVPDSTNPLSYMSLAAELLAIIQSGVNELTSLGITSPPIGGAGGQYNVIVRPGGVSSGNVYTSVESVYNASVAQGWQGQVLVTLDDSIQSPIVFPAMDFNVGSNLNWTFTGIASYQGTRGSTVVVFDDGFHFIPISNVQIVMINLDTSSPAVTDTVVVPVGIEFNLVIDGTALNNSGAGRFLSVDQTGEGGFAEIELRHFSKIGDGVHGVFQLGVGFGTVDAFTSSHITAASIVAGGGEVSYDASVEISELLGAGFTVNQTDNAGLITYTPSDATKWAGPVPTNVAIGVGAASTSALDRLAAAVEGLLGSPIP